MPHGYDQHGNHSFKDDVAEPVTGPQLLRDLYDDNGDGDEYGSAMQWLFATTEILYHLSAEEIPPKWGFRHGAHSHGDYRVHVLSNSGGDGTGETETEAEILAMYDDGLVTDDDLIEFGNGLNDDIDYLIKTGKDY